MENIRRRAEMAATISMCQGVGFDEALEKADELLKAQDEFIIAHMPATGKIIKCVTNDERLTFQGHEHIKLVVDRKYKVLAEEDEAIFIEDMETGAKIGKPLCKLRFEAIVE